jgi:hypothetical protein
MAATSNLVRYEDPLDVRERGAIGGFLAGYSGNTRLSYTTDLRLFARWCADQRLGLLDVRRAHLEIFARPWNRRSDALDGGSPSVDAVQLLPLLPP